MQGLYKGVRALELQGIPEFGFRNAVQLLGRRRHPKFEFGCKYLISMGGFSII